MTDTKQSLYQKLQESPMLYFSSGSKELFHSNFLYWLGTNYRDAFQAMMKSFCGITEPWPEGWKVRREHNHLDLCVTYDIPKKRKNSGMEEHVFIIVENKVKSVPDIAQLKRYESLYTNRNGKCTYILLSLMKVFHGKTDLDQKKIWKIRNYEELSKTIRDTFIDKKHVVSEEHIQYIIDYCKYIENLSKLTEGWIINESDSFLAPSKELEALRLNDIYEKIRYAQVATKLGDKLVKDGCEKKVVLGMSSFDVILRRRKDADSVLAIYGCSDTEPFHHIFISSGMAHSIGFVEAKVKIAEKSCAVIQVQGNRYCRGIEETGIVKKTDTLKPSWRAFITKGELQNQGISDYCHYGDGFLYKAEKMSDTDTISGVLSKMEEDICYILKEFKSV